MIYHEVSLSDKTSDNKSAIILAAERSYYDVIFQLFINGAQLPTNLELQNLPPLAVMFIRKLEEVDILNVIDDFIDAEESAGVDFDKILNGIETKVSQITDNTSLDRFFAEIPHYIPDTESHVICNDCETFSDIEQNLICF